MKKQEPSRELRFLQGGGEMGRRIREFNWERTELGNPATWPVSLKTAIGIVLNSGTPAYIAWGENLIQLYNDAYIPILGELKHPHALGSTTPETWSEIWDFVEPLFKSVMSSGEIITRENQLLLLHRSEYLEESYFNGSYSPLMDENGNINGVVVTAWETTQSVLNNRRNKCIQRFVEALSVVTSLDEIKKVFEDMVRNHPSDIPFGMWYEMRSGHSGMDLFASAGIKRNSFLSPDFLNRCSHRFYGTKINADSFNGAQYPIGDSPLCLEHVQSLHSLPRSLYITPLQYISRSCADAYLILGMNPLCPNDDAQKAFFEQIKLQLENTVRRISKQKFERQEQQHQFETVMHAIPCLIWLSGTSRENIFFNKSWLDFRGQSLEEELKNGWMAGICPDDLEKASAEYAAAFEKKLAFSLEYRLKGKEGTYQWILQRSMPRYTITGEFVGYISTCLDISDHKKAVTALYESEARYRQIVETAQEGIWIVDSEANTTFANAKMEELLGCGPGEMTGRSIYEFMDAEAHSDASRLMERRKNGVAEQHEFLLKKTDGSYLWTLMSASPFSHQGEQSLGALAMVIDITDRKKHEFEVKHLATHDSLTGLPNRFFLNERITQAIALAKHTSLKMGLLLIDFDNFKYINDSYGHSVGDALLQVVARQLRKSIRQDDIVARLGGDEFVILLLDANETSVTVSTVAQKILDLFNKPLRVGELELTVTASVGISLYPVDAESPEDLLKHADTALYQAKAAGRSGYQLYKQEMSDRAIARASLEAALRHALELGELELHYQPQVAILSGKAIGVEALVRWRHPELGMVSPATFIPVAEETGLIVPIGEWVIKTACAQNKAWQIAGLPSLVVSVNLSAVQLRQPGLLSMVENALKDTGLDPCFLELEITESMLINKTDSLITLLTSLKGLGVRLSLDDFGTGYSNLGYLQSFPLSQLKIDRSFIHGLPNNKGIAAIATAIVNMGHSLGLEVLAEGVETSLEAEFLRQISCNSAQGYYYSRPLPADLLEAWMKTHQCSFLVHDKPILLKNRQTYEPPDASCQTQ